MTKKKWAAGLLAAGVASGAGVWGWWAPEKVRARVESAFASRGIDASMEDVSIGIGGVRLEALRLQGSWIDGVVETVDVQGSLWSLATEGREAIDHVEMHGGQMVLRSEGNDAADGPSVRPTEAPSQWPTISVEGLQLTVHDEGGELASGRCALNVADDRIEMRAEDGQLGQAPGHRLAVDDGRLEFGKGTDGWRLGRGEARGVRLHLGEATRATEARVDALLGRLLGAHPVEGVGTGPGAEALEQSEESGGADALAADDSTTTDSTDDAPSEGVPANELAPDSTPEQPALAGAEVANGDEDGSDAALQPASEIEGPSNFDLNPLALLAEEGSFAIEEGSVFRGEEQVVETFSASVRVASERLHLEGEGAGAAGEASWSLVVSPTEPSIAGQLAFDSVALDVMTPFLPALPWWRPALTRVSAALDVEAGADGVLAMDGSLQVENAGFEHERLSPRPVANVDFAAEGQASFDIAANELTLRSLEVRMGEAAVTLEGSAARSADGWRLELDANMPPTDCEAAVGAIPRDLLAEAAGFRWDGRMQGSMHLRVDSQDLAHTDLDIDVDNRCRFLTVPAMADIRRVQSAFLHRVVEPDGSHFEMLAGPGSPNWMPMTAISPFLVQSVIAHEDAGFLRHRGFAVYAIRDALARNLREGRYVVGASTITMQLTKNLFLHREKTLARKVQEVLLTWWVESSLTKEEILELYLNIIEYGPRVYGIVQASDHYFGKRPIDLSAAESAFLATILPNPKGFHEHYERGSLNRSMRNRVGRFLRHLHSRGRIDDVALADGLAQLEAGLQFAGDGVRSEWPPRGDTSALPFSLSRPGDYDAIEEREGDPQPDPYEDDGTDPFGEVAPPR